MEKRRVVVTGLGAVTPIGIGTEAFWNSLKAGQVGIDRITQFDTEKFKVKLAAEVKDFKAADFMDVKSARRMERFSQFAVAAAKEALADSSLDLSKEDPYMAGCAIGSGIGSLQSVEREYERMTTKGPNLVNPLFVPMMISNMAAGNVAIHCGLKGKNINIVTACASGTHNIGEAFRSIVCGDADIMLAGGAEASITPIGVAGFMQLTALNTTEDPKRASIPFDLERNGFVIGEGAGILVLEELEHAKKRGAKIYAEMSGYGATCDANHITSPLEDGSGAAAAMRFALRDAGLNPEDIDYVNAHGTSTHLNDLSETKAIRSAFGAAADKLAVSSTKSMIGHLLGAAGGVEAVVLAKTIEEGYVHMTAGLEKDDPECALDYVKGEGRALPVRAAISNSLGFGGHNATILMRKYEA